MQKEELPKLMTVDEVLAYAGCSLRHLDDEIKRGNLRAYKPGKERKFFPDEVIKWIKKKAV